MNRLTSEVNPITRSHVVDQHGTIDAEVSRGDGGMLWGRAAEFANLLESWDATLLHQFQRLRLETSPSAGCECGSR